MVWMILARECVVLDRLHQVMVNVREVFDVAGPIENELIGAAAV